MSETRLSEIRARLDAAMPGPWRVLQDYDDEWFVLLGHGDGGIVATIEPGRTEESDAALIAHAPADLAYLLDTVARLTRELEEARERERALRDDLTAAIGNLSALVDLLHHDGYPEHSGRVARLVSAAEIYLESPSLEQEVGAATPQEASGAD